MTDRAAPGGIRPTESPLSGDAGTAEKKGRPPSGADDGKSGGRTQGGDPGAGTFNSGRDVTSHGHGSNAQRGGPSGSESEAEAPGAATYKKSDDLK